MPELKFRSDVQGPAREFTVAIILCVIILIGHEAHRAHKDNGYKRMFSFQDVNLSAGGDITLSTSEEVLVFQRPRPRPTCQARK